MDRVYVVIATSELEGTIYGSDLIGVYTSDVKAFAAMNDFDITKLFTREGVHDPILGHKIKGLMDGVYDETTYVTAINPEGDTVSGSVIISISEAHVK